MSEGFDDLFTSIKGPLFQYVFFTFFCFLLGGKMVQFFDG
jgi:hypothetical protein